MIKGIGIDIVEIDRITDGIENKILSEKELKILNKFQGRKRKKEFIAGRFSIKESLIKACGIFIPFKKIVILNNENGKPYIDEETLRYIEEIFGEIKIHISISHEKNYAVSMVIIEEVE
ncbi:ACP synthase [Marinitoga sp. 1197]|uniref:holo-ACP synthase n=1 Tax=Marinitoga sp. 1197 TaxID=1428449 RepID=UPI0006414A38|nr:holo-ACP synthase [Marinitoga sp. 1197]KLO21064.1 ACP synthase [Marinitoga sp. 1197]